MTIREGTSRSWPASFAGFLSLLGLCFAAAAFVQPRQTRLFAIYFGLVGLMLFVCAAAAWSATSARRVKVAPAVLRRASVAQWVVTALVWANPVALYAFACVAFIIVGHWPSYGHPDPKSLASPLLSLLVDLSFYVTAFGVVAWLLLFPMTARMLGSRGVRRQTVAWVLGLAAAYLVLYRNVGGVAEWYFD
jgi:hypothetical protein